MYFRWHITKKNDIETYMALESCEFYFYDSDGNKYEWAGATVSCDTAVKWTGQDVDKLIDGVVDGTHKWAASVSSITINVNVTFELADDFYPASYSFVTSADNSKKNPAAWELLVSEDGSTWKVADTQKNPYVPTVFATETEKFPVIAWDDAEEWGGWQCE